LHSFIVSKPSLHIKKAQRRFTKRLPRRRNLTYKQRLTKLKLRPLHFDLIMCYKIVFNIVKLYYGDFFHLAQLCVQEAIHTYAEMWENNFRWQSCKGMDQTTLWYWRF